MSDSKISALSAVTDRIDGDEYVLARSGASKKITVQNLLPERWTLVTKAASESVTSSVTLQNDDELFFTAVSAAVYEFELVIIYTGADATADIQFDLGEDGTARGSFAARGIGTSDAISVQNALTTQSAIAFGTSGSLRRAITVRGSHVGGGGTFRLRWAQNVSGSGTVTVLASSVLRYRRIL